MRQKKNRPCLAEHGRKVKNTIVIIARIAEYASAILMAGCLMAMVAGVNTTINLACAAALGVVAIMGERYGN